MTWLDEPQALNGWGMTIRRNQETCANPPCAEAATVERTIHGAADNEHGAPIEYNVDLGFCAGHDPIAPPTKES